MNHYQIGLRSLIGNAGAIPNPERRYCAACVLSDIATRYYFLDYISTEEFDYLKGRCRVLMKCASKPHKKKP